MEQTKEKLMTVTQVADYLGLSRQTIYEYIRSNAIPYESPQTNKQRPIYRFRKTNIDNWMKGEAKDGVE